MPASTLEPISASLKQAFQGMQAKATAGATTATNGSSSSSCLESGLQASAKKSLLSVVHFDSPIRHLGSSALNGLNGAMGLKSNLIFLNPSKKGSPASSNPSAGAASHKGSGPAKGQVNGHGDGPATGDEPPRPKIVYFPLRAVEVGYHRQRSSGAGMVNMGNTCYLNSTLQALFHTPALFNYLMSDFHKRECGKNGSGGFLQTCMICILTSTLKDTLSVNVMRPNRVYEKLKNICKHLVHGRQEDAHEFLRYLIESLQKSFLVSRHAPKNLDNASKETTPFNQIFGGYMRQDVTCLKCKYVSVTFQHFMDLLLDIRQTSNIDDALGIYFRAERIGSGDGVNTYKCEKCNMKVPAKKKCYIERPPVVLCVQLKRFSLLGGKISRSVQLSRRIELNTFVKKKDMSVSPMPPLQYKLVAMITHVGPSPNCGHYTAIGEASNGQFFQFDDASVRPISINQALNTASYVVFYEMTKQSKEAWVEQVNATALPKEQILKHLSSSKSCTATSSFSSTTSTVSSHSNGNSQSNTSSVPVVPKAKLSGLNGTVNKLGVVAKSTPSSLPQSSTGPKKPAQLVPYDGADSSDSSENETEALKQNGSNFPISTSSISSNAIGTTSASTDTLLKSSPFVPRSVTVNALKRSQEPRSEFSAVGNGSYTTNSVSKLSDHGLQKDVKPSGSGLWQVLETEHHNPSISSDNSNGSTSGAWHITPSTTAPTTTIAGAVVNESETTASPIVNGTKKNGQDPLELSDHDQPPQPRLHPTLPQQTSVTSSSTASSSLSNTPEHSRSNKRSSSIEEYEAELDRGRTKKVKKRHPQQNNIHLNNDAEAESSSRASFNSSNFNPFQAHQNKSYNGKGYQHHHSNDSNNQLPHHSQSSPSSRGFASRSSTWSGSRGRDRFAGNHRDHSRGGGKRNQNFRRTQSSSSLNGSEDHRNHHRDGHKNLHGRRRFSGGGTNYYGRGNRDYNRY